MTVGSETLRTPGNASRRLIRWLALLLLGIGVGNLGRAIVAVQYIRRLPDLPLTVPLPYLAAAGAGWGIALVTCAMGLWRYRAWSRTAALACGTLFQAHAWLNHLLFDASDYALQTRPRDLLVSALFLASLWGVLNLRGVRRVLRTAGRGPGAERTTGR